MLRREPGLLDDDSLGVSELPRGGSLNGNFLILLRPKPRFCHPGLEEFPGLLVYLFLVGLVPGLELLPRHLALTELG